MAALLAVHELAIGYGGSTLLSGINLSIDQGDWWGIVGPNGAGKTTLVKTLLGIIPALAGRIERRDDPEQRLDERSLAGAVGTDDTPPVALVDREVDTGQKRGPPVADGELVYREQRRHQGNALTAFNACANHPYS